MNRERNYKVISIDTETGLEELVCSNCEEFASKMIATSLNGAISSEWCYFYKSVPKDYVLYDLSNV